MISHSDYAGTGWIIGGEGGRGGKAAMRTGGNNVLRTIVLVNVLFSFFFVFHITFSHFILPDLLMPR